MHEWPVKMLPLKRFLMTINYNPCSNKTQENTLESYSRYLTNEGNDMDLEISLNLKCRPDGYSYRIGNGIADLGEFDGNIEGRQYDDQKRGSNAVMTVPIRRVPYDEPTWITHREICKK